jgi:hypothetical protein
MVLRIDEGFASRRYQTFYESVTIAAKANSAFHQPVDKLEGIFFTDWER